MTKKEILELIEDNIAPNNDKERKFFSSVDKNNNVSSSDEKTGNNQYRELANMCLAAQCYEEIKILIQYKEAKNDKGISWSRRYKDSTFAKEIISCMDKIKEQHDKDVDDKDCLNDLSLFFGYMYWNARIWSAEGVVLLKKELAKKGGQK